MAIIKLSQLPDPTVTTSIVMIDETVSGTTTSVQYLNLGVDSSGKVRLLRCNASDKKRMNNVNVAHYDGSEADAWMNDESTGYLSRFDSATRNALSSTSIKVKDETDGTIYEIARRCFLLSYTEVGYDNTGAEGASILDILKKWKNTINDDTARIATNDSGSAVNAWLRSPYNASQFRICTYIGSAYGDDYATLTNRWLRPCLSFDPDTLVSDPDENGICYLLPDPDKPYREAGITKFMGAVQATPAQGKLQVTAQNCLTGYPELYVTTNYNDSTPIWQQVQNDTVFDFSGSGTDLGVKMYARSETQAKIYEPVLIVGG